MTGVRYRKSPTVSLRELILAASVDYMNGDELAAASLFGSQQKLQFGIERDLAAIPSP